MGLFEDYLYQSVSLRNCQKTRSKILTHFRRLYDIHKSAMEKQLQGGEFFASSNNITSAADAILESHDQPRSGSPADASDSDAERRRLKNMPVVKVPQSKYIYVGRSVNVETPQLRDMGEATPPLEWLGVNMERLPQVTHQVCEFQGKDDDYRRMLTTVVRYRYVARSRKESRTSVLEDFGIVRMELIHFFFSLFFPLIFFC